MASLAMVSVSTTMIAINSFYPLSKSVHTLAMLSGATQTSITHTKKMAHMGQSTNAIGNGFSTVSAIMSSCSLLIACIGLTGSEISDLFFMTMSWVLGLIAGAALPVIAAGYVLTSCQHTSLFLVTEIKRQFDYIPYLAEGKAHPDMTHCADNIVRHCIDGLVIPGLIIVLVPIIIGYLFHTALLVALGCGAILSSITLGFYWSITGDIIHNAKHIIYHGRFGGSSGKNYAHIQDSHGLATVYKELLSPSLAVFSKSLMILAAVMMIVLL